MPDAIPNDEELERVIAAMEGEDATAAYLTISTGCRAACVHALWTDQLALGRDRVDVNWWSRKATKTKSGFVSYPHEWSFPPPRNVRDYVKGRAGDSRLLQRRTGAWSKDRLASTLTNLWRKFFPASNLTSYLGRDRLDPILKKEIASGSIDERLFKRLTDHTIDTANASYGKQTIRAPKKPKGSKKTAKKATAANAKKTKR